MNDEQPTTELAIRPEQTAFDAKQVAALTQLGMKNAHPADLAVFFHQVQRTGLDPFARQIYMIERQGKQTIQTGIDGFRLVARRSTDARNGTFGYEPTEWCGRDGKWTDVWLADEPPAAARVTVIRDGGRFPAVALFTEYAALKRDGSLTQMWATKGALMLAKCFDSGTEVLTDDGFCRFSDVGDRRIMQVTNDGLEAVAARPFAQLYSGSMVVWQSDDLDFAVTPNHDMVTTVGKVQASAMYATSNSRGPWSVPRIAPPSIKEADLSDASIQASAWVLGDGYARNGGWGVAVGRRRKIDAIRRLGVAISETVKHSRGKEAVGASGRVVRSNFDQVVFQIRSDDAPLVLADKSVDRGLLLTVSSRQARILVDTWIDADGHVDKRSGVRRIYTSREDHLAAIEIAAVIAGYSVSPRRSRTSDLGERPNYCVTLSERDAIPVRRHDDSSGRPTLSLAENAGGVVWCVTVPSGRIVVRRNGFSMICGNCAEALALRKAFPQDLSGLYTGDEMQAAGNQRPAQMPDHPGHGSRLAAALDAAEPELVTGEQLARLDALASDLGLTAQQKMDGVWAVSGRAVERVELLTKAEAAMCVESMERASAARVAVVADALTGEIIDDPDTGSNFPPTTGADA